MAIQSNLGAILFVDLQLCQWLWTTLAIQGFALKPICVAVCPHGHTPRMQSGMKLSSTFAAVRA